MHNDNDPDIKDAVLDAIRSGRASMRPRWHFVLMGLLMAVGAGIALCALLYLAGFIVFSLHQTGAWSAPMFGSRGWMIFFRSLPWTLLGLSLAFLLVLETLVRRHSFTYRTPLVYSVLGILALALVAGPLTAPWHRAPFQAARRGRLPFGGPFYRHFGAERIRNVRHGAIEGMAPGGFILRDAGNATSLILLAPRMRGMDPFATGDVVTAFGDEDEGGRTEIFRAAGVKKASF